MGDSYEEQVVVLGANSQWVIVEDQPLVFGRGDSDSVHGLDPTDTGISRLAGRIAVVGTGAVVENLSERRPIHIEYPTLVRHLRIEPGATHVLTADATVLVPGKNFTHALKVAVPGHLRHRTAPVGIIDPPSIPTEHGVLAENDRELLVALASGYLARWPRHDPNPRSYVEAAADLGISDGTAKKRLENLRLRLDEKGALYTSGTHAMRTVVEWAIDTGVVRVEDLNSAPRPSET